MFLLNGLGDKRLNKNEGTCPNTRASTWIHVWSFWLQIARSLILALVINVKHKGHVAHGFVTFMLWQSPNFVDFFQKDIGFFREIHLWLFESDKHVNCFSVNNTYQENFFFSNFKESCVVSLISSVCLIVICLNRTFLWKEGSSKRDRVVHFL